MDRVLTRLQDTYNLSPSDIAQCIASNVLIFIFSFFEVTRN